ncbi:acyltransferase family protein [uncultured Polaribacter sp.]|uniref:acyltransferase family protein n=1 Tax=uncultured Polaribacter sp. TaxID=174711 RepID=UPI00262A3C69|nr:acyltransferase family protein [uncultured Polaribacter sp.]
MLHTKSKRINWVDQLKGFSIILVVYGHNLPFIDIYIESFRIPLFFFIAGFFHPKSTTFSTIKKRAKQILIPYFLWSFMLFLFWFFIGRNYGDSASLNLSVLKNFLGLFYAQGGNEYMNWGITMWFLPAIFLSFLIFSFVRKLAAIKHQIIVTLVLIGLGFLIPKVLKMHLMWSLDVSMVALFFYAFGFFIKDFLFKNKAIKYEPSFLFFLFIFYIILAINFADNVDMYRSKYGNEFLFLLNASVGISFWVLFFRKLKKIKFLTFFGKNTIPVLALHIRALTVIKLFLILFWTSKSFDFNELEKIILVILQLLIIYPVILFINKKAPILNGKIKVLATRS